MYTGYDPQHEAEAAMKRAAEAEGADRQRLIRLALAWHQLARDPQDEHSSAGRISRIG
ncbi:RuvA C-terminal domain-containing protein [Bradyrhizobium sp. USDA 313]|uniref:RuvA C-terminal domain-containing protein n=1 Tax=Bradyrhizobium sp. USDA 313 TaxID=3156307 RepID=UPI003511DC8F